MPNILEELRNRILEAQSRLTETGRKLQLAQRAHEIASNDVAVWRAAFDSENREQQSRQEAAIASQPVFEGFVSQVEQIAQTPPDNEIATSAEAPPASPSETTNPNKTEIIRALLRQHPTGLTPPQIWLQVGEQFKHRPYMYSVLKRLKDRDEISFRRNKYVIRQESEVGSQPMLQ
jgi:hypothetical protein